MALYSFANGQIIPALRLLYRARYLAVLIYGDDHPDMAQLDVSMRTTTTTGALPLVPNLFCISESNNCFLFLPE